MRSFQGVRSRANSAAIERTAKAALDEMIKSLTTGEKAKQIKTRVEKFCAGEVRWLAGAGRSRSAAAAPL